MAIENRRKAAIDTIKANIFAVPQRGRHPQLRALALQRVPGQEHRSPDKGVAEAPLADRHPHHKRRGNQKGFWTDT
jgi:hypothetical protein